MAVFACSGAQWLTDKIDQSVLTCGGWVAVASSTSLYDQSQANLISSELQNRACATQSQPTSIRTSWVGTQTFGIATCVGAAGNFPSTSTGTVGGLIVGGEFTKVPVNINDAIQFTVTLDLT